MSSLQNQVQHQWSHDTVCTLWKVGTFLINLWGILQAFAISTAHVYSVLLMRYQELHSSLNHLLFFLFFRWLHGSCDGLVNEEELDQAAEYGYHCLYCRPKTKHALVGVSGMSCRNPSASQPFLSFLSSAGTNTLHG